MQCDGAFCDGDIQLAMPPFKRESSFKRLYSDVVESQLESWKVTNWVHCRTQVLYMTASRPKTLLFSINYVPSMKYNAPVVALQFEVVRRYDEDAVIVIIVTP